MSIQELTTGITRRGFVQALGAGLLISVLPDSVQAQRGRGRGGGFGGSGAQSISARVHIAKDGTITVMTGKVEGGQGARTELSMAAAEELRVPLARIRLIMADTALVPDDGITAGSRSTPSSVPAVRQGCAAARNVLVALAAKAWGVKADAFETRDGKVIDPTGKRELSYGELAGREDAAEALKGAVPSDVTLTAVKDWKVMGVSAARPNARDIVTGAHQYPSDIARPGMLHGKVLRPPTYGAKLISVDLAPAQAMTNVVAARDGDFVGVAAPTLFQAADALEAVAQTAKWEPAKGPSNKDIYAYLKEHAQGGLPKNPLAEDVAKSSKSLQAEYHVAYVQHAPLEPRAAVAEWSDGVLTVWTGSQNPFGCHGELAGAFRLTGEKVRVIIPDFGAGFGGKHTGEAGVEAARLAKAAGKPVSLRWTREEEFACAYYRPAAVIEMEAGLDAAGAITAWRHVNINSGPSSMETPYNIAKARSQFVPSESPLRQGSYRALAATANTFARECFMDELAAAADRDPLEFRLAHIENPRLRAVLETAAKRFGWSERVKRKAPGVGVGLACGTEKGSFVAAAVEIAVESGKISIRHVCQVFECGAIINPANLESQVKGCLLMGLGPALREEIEFAAGEILNGSFAQYAVPRFRDVPELDVYLLNRPDLPSVGAGETPIIAIAPAIANAVAHATGKRVRSMPIRRPTT
jgi:isoquinoline 1-oxidoreductase subunit beta